MFWRTQTKLKGLTPAIGASPNFVLPQKVLSDSNIKKCKNARVGMLPSLAFLLLGRVLEVVAEGDGDAVFVECHVRFINHVDHADAAGETDLEFLIGESNSEVP